MEKTNIGMPKITEGDWAPWKHMRYPPCDHTVQRSFRALYVVADPRDAILSVFRRGYQHWHIQRLDGDVSGWDYSWNLEKFLLSGHDHFRLRDHFDNWVKARRSYPIMVLKYHALWEHLSEVFKFFGVPLAWLERFPQREARKVNWRSEAKEVQDALNNLYGDLAENITMMEDINVLLPSQNGPELRSSGVGRADE
jgi:hypothetical protein